MPVTSILETRVVQIDYDSLQIARVHHMHVVRLLLILFYSCGVTACCTNLNYDYNHYRLRCPYDNLRLIIHNLVMKEFRNRYRLAELSSSSLSQ